MPEPVLDLAKYAWRHRHHNLVFTGTWFRNADNRWRPCMVITRDGDEKNLACVPYIIPLDGCWVWSEEVGDGEHCARACVDIARTMRLAPIAINYFAIRGWIADHLGDLINMPPYQGGREHVADLIIRDRSTGKTLEIEVRGDV